MPQCHMYGLGTQLKRCLAVSVCHTNILSAFNNCLTALHFNNKVGFCCVHKV